MASERLTITIDANVKSSGSVKSLEKSLQGVDSTAKNVSKSVSGLGKTIAKAGAAAAVFATGALIKGAIKAASALEDLEAQFVAFTGSAENAAAAVQELRDFTAATPFRLEEVAQAGRSLLAFGEAQENVTARLKILGNVAAGTGSDLGELTTVFGQIQGEGKLTADRFNQLIDRGINIGPALAESLGVAQTEIRGLISAGKVSAEEVSKAFDTIGGEGGKFAGSLERLSQTASGLFSTLQDNVQNSIGEIGKILEPVTKDILNNLNDLAKRLPALISSGLKAIGPIVAGAIKVIQTIAPPILNLIELIAAGLFGLIKVIRSVRNAFLEFKVVRVVIQAVAKTFSDFLSLILKGVKAAVGSLGDLVGIDTSRLENGLKSIQETVEDFGNSDVAENLSKGLAKSDAITDAVFDGILKGASAGQKALDNLNADKLAKQLSNIGSGVGKKVSAGSTAAGTDSSTGPTQDTNFFDEFVTNFTSALDKVQTVISETLGPQLTKSLVGSVKAVAGAIQAGAQGQSDIIARRKEIAKLEKAGAITAQEAAKERIKLAEEEKKLAEDGAFDAVKGVTGAVVDAFLPGFGQLATFFVDLLKDPEATVAFINSLVDALPAVVEALILAMPDVSIALAEAVAIKVPIAILKGLAAGIGRLLGTAGRQLSAGITQAFSKIGEFIRRLANSVFAPLRGLVSAFKVFSDTLKKFRFPKIGGSSGPKIGGTLGQVGEGLKKVFGFASGGTIKGQGTRDTVPAVLTPGELVVDRSTTRQLQDFLAAKAKAQPETQMVVDNSNMEVLLSAILAALNKPQQVATQVNINENELANVILELNRDNKRIGG